MYYGKPIQMEIVKGKIVDCYSSEGGGYRIPAKRGTTYLPKCVTTRVIVELEGGEQIDVLYEKEIGSQNRHITDSETQKIKKQNAQLIGQEVELIRYPIKTIKIRGKKYHEYSYKLYKLI